LKEKAEDQQNCEKIYLWVWFEEKKMPNKLKEFFPGVAWMSNQVEESSRF